MRPALVHPRSRATRFSPTRHHRWLSALTLSLAMASMMKLRTEPKMGMICRRSVGLTRTNRTTALSMRRPLDWGPRKMTVKTTSWIPQRATKWSTRSRTDKMYGRTLTSLSDRH